MQALISGFTFVKSGLTLGYPIKESIESLEPLCDQVVITVGFDDPDLKTDDGTYQYLRDHFRHKKFLFQKSFWNPKMAAEGFLLAQQANCSLRECRGKYCQFLHADEVLHENELFKIHNAVIEMEKNPKIQGLLFNYKHFYGNCDTIKHSADIYRREVRLIRNHIGTKALQNIQGFKGPNDEKLLCQSVDAQIFHYGLALKNEFLKLRNDHLKKLLPKYQAHNEYEHVWGLKEFIGSHPRSMQSWIEQNKNELAPLKLPPKHHVKNLFFAASDVIENLTGIRLGEYKSYKHY